MAQQQQEYHKNTLKTCWYQHAKKKKNTMPVIKERLYSSGWASKCPVKII